MWVTYLVVVDDVDPGNDMNEQLRVPRVPSCHALQIGRQLGVAIQGLAMLDPVNHLSHIHLNFPGVLRESIEATYDIVSHDTARNGIDSTTYGRIAGKAHEDRQ